MGGSQSVEIPGGGTEGYHVLRVSSNSLNYIDKFNWVFILSTSSTDVIFTNFLSLIFRSKATRQARKPVSRHFSTSSSPSRIRDSIRTMTRSRSCWRRERKLKFPWLVRISKQKFQSALKKYLMTLHSIFQCTAARRKSCEPWRSHHRRLGVVKACSACRFVSAVLRAQMRMFGIFSKFIQHRRPSWLACARSAITLSALIRFCTRARTCSRLLRRMKENRWNFMFIIAMMTRVVRSSSHRTLSGAVRAHLALALALDICIGFPFDLLDRCRWVYTHISDNSWWI